MAPLHRLLPVALVLASCADRVTGAPIADAAPDVAPDVAPACVPSAEVDVAAVGRPMGIRHRVQLPPSVFVRAAPPPTGCGTPGQPTAFLRYEAPARGWVDLVVRNAGCAVWGMPSCGPGAASTCARQTLTSTGTLVHGHGAQLEAGQVVHLALACADPSDGIEVDFILARERVGAGAFCEHTETPRPVRCDPGTGCVEDAARHGSTCRADGTLGAYCRTAEPRCDDDLRCNPQGRCLPPGTSEGACRETDPPCDPGFTCSAGRCGRITQVACGGAISGCPAGEQCVVNPGTSERRCVPDGSLGASCHDSRPCAEGLVCRPYGRMQPACVVPLPPGAPCDRAVEACTPGFACAPDGAASRCQPLGEFGAPCSSLLPCRAGLGCTSSSNGVCARVAREGEPCDGQTGATCAWPQLCNANGRCEHHYAFCPPGQFRSNLVTRCVPGRAGGEPCDPRLSRDLCLSGALCRDGRCPADGARNGLCRPAAPACDEGLECGAGGVCVTAIDRLVCTNGRSNDCDVFVGSRCAYNAAVDGLRCARVGTVGGGCRGADDAPDTCDAGLHCAYRTCFGMTTPGGLCGLSGDVPYACPSGTTCRSQNGTVAGRCVPAG